MMGGYVADAYGYRAVFYASSLIVFVCVFLVLFLVGEPAESAAVAARARMESPLSTFRSIVSVRSVALLITFTLVGNLTFGMVGPVLPLYIQQLVTNPERLASTAGTISGVAAFGAALAALVIGRLSDAIGHRKIVLICGAGIGLTYVPQAFARSALALGAERTVTGSFPRRYLP